MAVVLFPRSANYKYIVDISEDNMQAPANLVNKPLKRLG